MSAQVAQSPVTMNYTPTLRTPMPVVKYVKVSYPAPHVMAAQILRMAINDDCHWEMHRLFNWFEDEPELWTAIVTGSGEKVFVAGQDLSEWLGKATSGAKQEWNEQLPPSGFGGISRRTNGKKPIIAAVNGHAMGGGFEIVLNCDIVVASKKALFALPEVKRGVFPAAGGLARVYHTLGLQRASELALTGRPISAMEAQSWGVINAVVDTPADVMNAALKYAKMLNDNSPHSVQIAKNGIRLAQEFGSVERATMIHNDSELVRGLALGANFKEGLLSFNEKRAPKWKSVL